MFVTTWLQQTRSSAIFKGARSTCICGGQIGIVQTGISRLWAWGVHSLILGKEICFLYSKMHRSSLGSIHPNQWALVSLSLGVKWPKIRMIGAVLLCCVCAFMTYTGTALNTRSGSRLEQLLLYLNISQLMPNTFWYLTSALSSNFALYMQNCIRLCTLACEYCDFLSTAL
jgi:hypothetical protein